MEQCVIYARTESTVDSGDSSQLDSLRGFCSDRYTVVSEFKDFGKKLKAYGAIDQLLHFVQENISVKFIIVSNVDRFTRAMGRSRLCDYLDSLGHRISEIELVSIDDGPFSTSLKALRQIIAAPGESASISKKTSEAMRSQASQGIWMGRLPSFGYERKRYVQIVKIVEQQPTIDEAFRMKLVDRSSNEDIVEMCNQNGLSINISQLISLFRNRFFSGATQTRGTGGRIIKGQFEGYISEPRWEELQKILDSESGKTFKT